MLDQDWKIIKQCLAGQTGNFEALIDRYQKPIFNLAYRMVSDFQDAEDITQTVFIKAYESLNSFNPKYKFFSWIYRMAINETLNVINKKNQLAELDQNAVSQEKQPDTYYEEKELSQNIQESIDHMAFCSQQEFLIYDGTGLNLPSEIYERKRSAVNWEDASFDEFLAGMSALIFDKPVFLFLEANDCSFLKIPNPERWLRNTFLYVSEHNAWAKT